MAQQSKTKKSKRPANDAKRARMATGWRNAQARHKANREIEAARHHDNEALRELGLPLPWEIACAKRAEVRFERFGPPRSNKPGDGLPRR